jgi:hypothetical protein
LTFVILLDPKNAGAYDGLAWRLAPCLDASVRNGLEAESVAKKACELTEWKDWSCIGTLAAAYAEAGDFEQDVKCQKKALSMGSLTVTERKEAQEQIDLFQQRNPFRDNSKR